MTTQNLTFDDLRNSDQLVKECLQSFKSEGENYIAYSDVDGLHHAILNNTTGRDEDEAIKECMIYNDGKWNDNYFLYPIDELINEL